MGVINRILLLLFSVIVLAGVAICAAVFFHAFPEKVWTDQLNLLLARRETVLALFIVGVIALHFVGVSLSSNASSDESVTLSHDEMMVAKSETGDILVAIAAVKHLAERISKTVAGVRDSKATVLRTKENVLHIKLTLFVAQGIDATIVGQSVAREVQNAIRTSLQIQDIPVDIFIKNISNERLNDRRVV